MGDTNQLIVLKINQINGINDEIVISENDLSATLAERFAEVNDDSVQHSLFYIYLRFNSCAHIAY